MKILSFLKKSVPIAFIAMMPVMALSQEDQPTIDEPSAPTDVPIDDGLPFLIAAGIGMGIYKAYVANQKKRCY